jgi:hypothetical protein
MKNNKNIKNVFLDCGTHLCEGLIDFYNKGIINDTFEIHTFEANPACNIEERVKQIPLNIVPYNKAVWIEDGVVTFNQENHQKSKTGSPTDGYSDIDGWGSSVDGIGFNHAGYDLQLFLLNAAFMGVPQYRERVFFIGQKKKEFKHLKLEFKEKPISFNDLRDTFNKGKPVPKSLVGAGPWMAKNKTDEVVKWAMKNQGKEKFFTIKGILFSGPAKTLSASSRHISYNSDFFLSDLDCIHLQSFPDDYNFMGKDAGYFCGMSVPPIMMAQIASEIQKQLLS